MPTESIFDKIMRIYRATNATEDLVQGIANLLPQLSSSAAVPSLEDIERLLADKNCYLLIAEADGTIAGMLSLVVVEIPTGRKAWIEDVVVDAVFRGQNIGVELVEKAKEIAIEIGAKKLYLTSNPSRQAAHRLYAKCGFEKYDTTLFRYNL